jgi:hypothetical protein
MVVEFTEKQWTNAFAASFLRELSLYFCFGIRVHNHKAIRKNLSSSLRAGSPKVIAQMGSITRRSEVQILSPLPTIDEFIEFLQSGAKKTTDIKHADKTKNPGTDQKESKEMKKTAKRKPSSK